MDLPNYTQSNISPFYSSLSAGLKIVEVGRFKTNSFNLKEATEVFYYTFQIVEVYHTRLGVVMVGAAQSCKDNSGARELFDLISLPKVDSSHFKTTEIHVLVGAIVFNTL